MKMVISLSRAGHPITSRDLHFPEMGFSFDHLMPMLQAMIGQAMQAHNGPSGPFWPIQVDLRQESDWGEPGSIGGGS